MGSGRVMWFNQAEGFGFISDDNGRKIYFHYTQIIDASSKMSSTGGAVVYFDLFETSLVWEASNVRLFSLV